jgi:hypothetical protein
MLSDIILSVIIVTILCKMSKRHCTDLIVFGKIFINLLEMMIFQLDNQHKDTDGNATLTYRVMSFSGMQI